MTSVTARDAASYSSQCSQVQESQVWVVLLACKEDMVSPAFLIESADLKIVETVDGVKPW
ncbi:hypothetical protein E2C01_024639 [Portunus trituberculatus]|uniref:Uncharacterized protein n=1 Tax=Portunus trituberculatus TaxID=210409 RepID=A0A5B7EB49_PORTR|nr:hypothetical protein [Portunus trituberculatus]